MSQQSDSKKQNLKNKVKKCSFCDNEASLFVFKINRGASFVNKNLCKECVSSASFVKIEADDCPCCGTTRLEVENSGSFTCDHCFMTFRDLESKFPDQFRKNLNELELRIKIIEIEDMIKSNNNDKDKVSELLSEIEKIKKKIGKD